MDAHLVGNILQVLHLLLREGLNVTDRHLNNTRACVGRVCVDERQSANGQMIANATLHVTVTNCTFFLSFLLKMNGSLDLESLEFGEVEPPVGTPDLYSAIAS